MSLQFEAYARDRLKELLERIEKLEAVVTTLRQPPPKDEISEWLSKRKKNG